MKRFFISLACYAAGAILWLAFLVLALYAQALWLIVIAVAVAAIDANQCGFWKFQREIRRLGDLLVFGPLFFGWLIMPWYIGLRLRMMAGVARPIVSAYKLPYRFGGRLEE